MKASVLFAFGAALVACSAPAEPRAARTASADRPPVAVRGPSEAARGGLVCDRVVDDFRLGGDGDFPVGWETHPASAVEVAKKDGLYRVVTVDGRRALQARSGSVDITLGRGIEDWDLSRYPVVEWTWRAHAEPSAPSAVATLSAVWMIGLPFFVRRLGYAVSINEPRGTLRSERFGYDRWLTIERSPAPGWRTVRVNLLADYRKYFERNDSDAPTGLALSVPPPHAEAYFADIRLCRPSLTDATSKDLQP